MNRNLLLLVIGLIVATYAILAMPPMIEETECVSFAVNDDGPYCSNSVTTERKNEFRFPLAVGGGVIALIGGVKFDYST